MFPFTVNISFYNTYIAQQDAFGALLGIISNAKETTECYTQMSAFIAILTDCSVLKTSFPGQFLFQRSNEVIIDVKQIR